MVPVPLFGDQPTKERAALSIVDYALRSRGFDVTVDYRNTNAQKVFETYSAGIATFLSL